ncbi:MAG: hypothetical protein L0211_24480 [Planctomycetaceae bacterium]|nr:hypothetical protein [Planctomycetaceae bacterium]
MPRLLCTIGLALVIAVLAAARSIASDTTTLLAQRLMADVKDGELGQFDLLSACLIAGGVSDADELDHQRRLLATAIEGVLACGPLTGTADERALELLTRLHARVLTGSYSKGATSLSCVVATGDFNCLSASVLFGELCERARIPVEYWSQPGHVYCRLRDSGLRIEPASRPNGASVAELARAQSKSPEVGRLQLRVLSPVQLVAKFYYNRGVEQLQRREFEAGIASLRRASQLDPLDADAQANLLAGLNNWALALAEQDQPAAAAALVSRGLAIDPHYAPLIANQRYLAERARAAVP